MSPDMAGVVRRIPTAPSRTSPKLHPTLPWSSRWHCRKVSRKEEPPGGSLSLPFSSWPTASGMDGVLPRIPLPQNRLVGIHSSLRMRDIGAAAGIVC